MRTLGIDSGSHWIAFVAAQTEPLEGGAPFVYFRHTEPIGVDVPLAKPRTAIRGGVETTITHYRAITDESRRALRAYVLGLIKSLGIERVIIERPNRVNVPKGANPQTTQAIASSIAMTVGVADFLAGVALGADCVVATYPASTVRARVVPHGKGKGRGSTVRGTGSNDLEPVLLASLDGWNAPRDASLCADPAHERDAAALVLYDAMGPNYERDARERAKRERAAASAADRAARGIAPRKRNASAPAEHAPARPRAPSVPDRIVSALASGPLRASALAAAIGHATPGPAVYHAGIMVRAGVLTQPTRGVYALASIDAVAPPAATRAGCRRPSNTRDVRESDDRDALASVNATLHGAPSSAPTDASG